MPRRLFAVVIFFALALPQPAHAEGGGFGVSLSVLGGYGANESNGVAGSTERLNAYGAGAGVRAGLRFGGSGFLGASYVRHQGFSRTLQGGAFASALGVVSATPAVQVASHLDPLMAELGFELHVDEITLRPYASAGVVLSRTSFAGGAGTTDASRPAVAPGLALELSLTESVFFGTDLRYVAVIPGDGPEGLDALGGTANAFIAAAALGLRF